MPALFITALIFSFSHVINEGPFAPVALFPMAVVLGYLRLRTGRLAAGMVAHGVFNAASSPSSSYRPSADRHRPQGASASAISWEARANTASNIGW